MYQKDNWVRVVRYVSGQIVTLLHSRIMLMVLPIRLAHGADLDQSPQLRGPLRAIQREGAHQGGP